MFWLALAVGVATRALPLNLRRYPSASTPNHPFSSETPSRAREQVQVLRCVAAKYDSWVTGVRAQGDTRASGVCGGGGGVVWVRTCLTATCCCVRCSRRSR
jgi:hypothetical protein